MANQRIGAYEVLSELGRGGMGVVYRARHVELGREVALKMLLEAGALDPTAEQRFQIEAEAVAKLRHPGIVNVYELGVHGGRPYFSMDFVEGESLGARLKRGPLEAKEAARMARAVADAIVHAHGRGVLHRDLKPDNVLLDADGRPLVTDFGLAKDTTETRERLTRTGQILGTPAYMPPEQVDGQVSAIDARSDVYSLGATLHAMLTGRPPFEARSVLGLMKKVLTDPPVAPSKIQPGVPAALDAIVLRCLAKDREDRYATAAALRDDLDRFLRGERPLAQGEGAGTPRAAVAGAVAGVVLVLAGVGFWASGDPNTEAPPVEAPPVEAPPLEAPPLEPGAPKGLTDAQVAEGYAQYEGLEHAHQTKTIQAWLDAFPGHPKAEKATARLAKLELLNPLVTIELRVAINVKAAFAGSERVVACGGQSLKLWSARTGDELQSFEVGDSTALAVAPDGKTVVVGGDGGWLRAMDLDRGNFGPMVEAGTMSGLGLVTSMAFDALGERDAVCGTSADQQEGLVVVLKAADLSEEQRFPLGAAVWAVAFSPSGQFLAATTSTSTDEHRVSVLDLTTAQVHPWCRTLTKGFSVTYSPDGKKIAYGLGWGFLWLWTPGEASEAFVMGDERGRDEGMAHMRTVSGVAFTPDGKRLVSVSWDFEQGLPLKVWDVATRNELETAPKIREKLLGVSLSPDGRRALVTAEKKVEIWALPR